MTNTLPTGLIGLSIEALKNQAKHLRASLAKSGTTVSHSQSLELLAHQFGYKNWNVLHATVGNGPSPSSKPATRNTGPVQLGEVVEGHYLGQKFTGEVIGVSKGAGDRYRVTLDFKEPVDVVTFDSFSAFRKRVSCHVDRNGISPERTSNGQPHMQIQL